VKFGEVYTDKPGHPPLPTRLMPGLAILKHTYDLSDEALCDRWGENPSFPVLLRRGVFPTRVGVGPFVVDAWRHRMGEEKLQALLQESPSGADPDGCEPSDFCPRCDRHDGAAEDGDVPDRCQAAQPGARAAGATDEEARSEPAPILLADKLALIKHQRHAHAHQFKCANRSLRKLKTYLGRVIRDIERRIVANEDRRPARS